MADKKPSPKAKTVACEVLRDFWDADGNRTCKGAIVDLDPMEAIALIEESRVRRVK